MKNKKLGGKEVEPTNTGSTFSSPSPYKDYHCKYCNKVLTADEDGIYIHSNTYHYDGHIYDTEFNTQHIVPVGRLHLRH